MDKLTFRMDIFPAIKKYIFAVFTLLPGYVLGQYILIPWCVYILFLLTSKKPERIITVYVIWEFLGPGAWHYHLLGPDRKGFIYAHFDEFIIIAFFILYILKRKQKNETLTKYLNFSLIFFSVALFSGIINFVNPYYLFNYFTSNNFRWLILFFLLSKVQISKKYLKSLVVLLLVIIMINSILGVLQSTILPSQEAPSGYLPSRTDVASGLTGLTNAQRLSTLCIGFSFYFLLRFLSGLGNYNLIYVIILIFQVIFTASNAAVLFGIVQFLFLLLLLIKTKIKILRLSYIFSYSVILIILIIGARYLQIYSKEHYNYGPTDRLTQWIKDKRKLEDFEKFRGMNEAITNVANQGNLGFLFGIGPSNFASTIGLKREVSSIEEYGFEVEGTFRYSAAAKRTDLTVILGETGVFGGITFLILMIYILVSSIKRIKKGKYLHNKIFTIFVVVWIFCVILNSFYMEGWMWSQFCIPMIVFIVYDVKFNTKKLSSNDVNNSANI